MRGHECNITDENGRGTWEFPSKLFKSADFYHYCLKGDIITINASVEYQNISAYDTFNLTTNDWPVGNGPWYQNYTVIIGAASALTCAIIITVTILVLRKRKASKKR